MYAYFEGDFVPEDKITFGINDLGLLRGYGVFDFSFAKNGKIYLPREHLKRFFKSASFLGLKPPFSPKKILKVSSELARKNNYYFSSVRWVLTGGTSKNGRDIDKETFFILNQKTTPLPDKYYTKGVKVVTVNFEREIPEIKSLNYQFLFSMYPKLNKKGAFELIYAPHGTVLEGGSSNVFIIKNSIIKTPPEKILVGVTREEVIKIAKKNNLKYREEKIRLNDLLNADEVFITATLKKVLPVTKVDTTTIGAGKPGPITKEIMKLYDNSILKHLN